MSTIDAVHLRRRKIDPYRPVIFQFTLIEALVVVIILGILAAIAIPIYIGVRNGGMHGAAPAAGATTAPPSPTVHSGWVQVFKDDPNTFKRCDGSTLLYRYDRSISSYPNSRECT